MEKKVVTTEQLLESARKSAALTAQVASAAAAALEEKQDKLTGTAGQIVGFNAAGQPVAQAAPSGGVTMDQVTAAIETAITGAINASY